MKTQSFEISAPCGKVADDAVKYISKLFSNITIFELNYKISLKFGFSEDTSVQHASKVDLA